MNKVKFLTFAVIALFILNGAIITLLWLDRRQLPGADGRADKIIIEKLQLSPMQVQEFEKLKRDHRATVRILQDSIRLLKTAFIDQLRSDNPDHIKAEKIATDISQLQRKIEMVTFLHFQSLRDMCDDRQKQLFDDFIQEIARMLGRPPGPPGKNRP